METKRFALVRNSLRAFGALSLLTLLASGEAHAAGIWTHVASACAVDEASAAKYDVNAARFKVKTGQQPATVVARCNVTNPQDDGSDPWWNTLEVTYRDPDGTGAGSQVKALLYRVTNATGGVVLIGTFDSNAYATTGDYTARVLVGGAADFDFDNYAYFVEIQVKRSDTANDPTISIVRLYEDLF